MCNRTAATILSCAALACAACSSSWSGAVTTPDATGEPAHTSGNAYVALTAPCAGPVDLTPKGDPGSLLDDQEGADVTCRYDASGFEISLYAATAGIEARGSFTGGTSDDVQVEIVVPGRRYRSVGACTVTFDARSGGTLSGEVRCPTIEERASAARCSTSDASVSRFRFVRCEDAPVLRGFTYFAQLPHFASTSAPRSETAQ